MSNTETLIKKTAKFLNVSEEAARKIVADADRRNAITANKGRAMLSALKEGKMMKGGIWA